MAQITNKLLQQAIADAEAVRETAVANAKLVLEEAITPQIREMIARRLRVEAMEGEEEKEGDEKVKTEAAKELPFQDAEAEGGKDFPADSSTVGTGDNKEPSDASFDASGIGDGGENKEDSHTDWYDDWSESDFDLDEVIKELEEDIAALSEAEHEGEEEGDEESMEEGEYNADGEEEVVAEEEDEDELDLESIIRELEGELEEEDGEEEMHEEEEEEEAPVAEEESEEEMHEEEGEESSEEDSDEEIDLDEILREMGYGEEEEEEVNEEEEEDKVEEMEKELEEAYKVIKSLKSTINEVNLLNAKLLYTNKLFRSYDLTNEQKHKVVETLDRTGNVREVKLVFSTLAESFKFTGTTKKVKQTAKINESFASKPVASTAPKKAVITESTNKMAERFKQLANIK